MKVGDGVTGWVALHRQPLVVPDVTQEPRFQWIRGVDQKRLVAMLSVPILAGSRMIGVVNVQSEERREFDKADIDFLGAIAGQVAGIIERSQLQQRLEAQLEEIRGSQAIHERFTALALAGAEPGAIPRRPCATLRGAPVELLCDPPDSVGARRVKGLGLGDPPAWRPHPSRLSSGEPVEGSVTRGQAKPRALVLLRRPRRREPAGVLAAATPPGGVPQPPPGARGAHRAGAGAVQRSGVGRGRASPARRPGRGAAGARAGARRVRPSCRPGRAPRLPRRGEVVGDGGGAGR